MTLTSKFRERFGVQFRENESLAKHLNIRIGGPAAFFVEARSTQDVIDAVTMAQNLAVPYVLLGGGSNTMVADEGYSGLVIKVANRAMRVDGDALVVEAGVISAAAARTSAEAGLRGFEWAISLPGTIGGAIRGNAGCFGGEMKDTVESVRVLRDGNIVTLTNEECMFGYRDSVFKKLGNRDVILDAVIRLARGDRAEALAAIAQNLERRKTSQPLGLSSAGCMFVNYTWTDDDAVAAVCARFPVPQEFLDRKRIPAGWIIDQLGLKGTAVGDAEVSLQHGNFLLNKGHATARDVSALVELIQRRVRDETGVMLHEEVQRVG